MTTITRIIAAILAVIAVNGAMFFVTKMATDAAGVPAHAVIYEDGSWRAPNGDTGCIAGQPCE